MNNKEIIKKFTLKKYLYFLLLNIIKDNESLSVFDSFLGVYNESLSNKKVSKLFLIFYREFKLLFKNLKIKKEKIIYNKIKKILIDIVKISKNKDKLEILNLEIENLHKENLFLYLPYNIIVDLKFKK